MLVINSKAKAIEYLRAKPANLPDVVFSGVDFSGVVFDFPADFSGSTFRGPVRFARAVFAQPAWFDGATFADSHETSFQQAEFLANVSFQDATFNTFAVFDRAVFCGACSFAGSRFFRGARFLFTSFQEVTFFNSFCAGMAVFWHAVFGKSADFSQFTVEAPPNLAPSSDLQTNFSWAVFDGEVRFSLAKLLTPAFFWRTIFRKNVAFDFTRFAQKVVFGGRQTDVHFTRAGDISRPALTALQQIRLFVHDREVQFGENYMFNDVFSKEDVVEKLDALGPGTVTPAEKALIVDEWVQGAQKMFADDAFVNFNGAVLEDLTRSAFNYVNLDNVQVDWNVGGPEESKAHFVNKIRENSTDFFISHASEDKQAIAEPLARRLTELGQVVWLDRNRINYGDDLRALIDGGIEKARFYVIIASRPFFSKEWTQYELNKVLPRIEKVRVVLYGLEAGELRQFSRELEARVAFDFAKFNGDISALARELVKSARRPPGATGSST
jgi:uncharacterized protein YjbI with pentapeptide repeats